MIECQFCHQVNIYADDVIHRLESELTHMRMHEYELKRELDVERAKLKADQKALGIMKMVLDAIDNATQNGDMNKHLVKAANMLDVYIRNHGGWK